MQVSALVGGGTPRRGLCRPPNLRVRRIRMQQGARPRQEHRIAHGTLRDCLKVGGETTDKAVMGVPEFSVRVRGFRGQE
jgi:hypothetical protein